MRRDQEAEGNYPFDFDENAKKPLALRRGSDAQARKSLIEKYNDEINQSSDKSDSILEYNLKKENPRSSDEQSLLRLEDELKTNRNKKIKIALIVAAILIVVVTIILIFALKSDPRHDDNPEEKQWDQIVNPYVLEEITDFTDPRSFSFRKYLLKRDKSLETKGNYSGFANETLDNKFIDFVTLQSSIVGNFGTLRLQVYDHNSTDPYLDLNEYLSPEFVDAQNAYNLDYSVLQNYSFTVQNHKNNSRRANESDFTLKAFYSKQYEEDGKILDKEEFMTTKDQSLIMMTHYQQLTLQFRSHRFLGWGDKKNDQLFLNEGNYTIFPKMSDQGSGAHPFLIMETVLTQKFAGVFVLNSSPINLEIDYESNFWSKLTFRQTGGNFDIFIFYGPTFNDVLKQYYAVIGKPHMLPLFAHGFYSMSSAYNDSTKAIEAVEKYKAEKIPLAGLVLPLSYQNDYFTNSSQIVAAIRNSYPKSSDLKLIYPFSYFAPDKGDQQLGWVNKLVNFTNGDTLVVKAEGYKLYVEMLPDETSDKHQLGWCMDVFHSEFENGFLAALLKDTTELSQGYWLQKNTPVILKDDHEFSDPWILPYRPSNFDHTLDEQAEHTITQNYQKKKIYHSAVHSIYGSKLAKSFVESLPAYRVYQSTPFVISDSSFSGLGSKGVAHLISAPTEDSYENLQSSLISMIKMGIFGMPNVGTQMCASSNSTYVDEELCARYFQLAVVSPLAFVKSKSIEQHIFNFKNETKRAISNSLKQRMELIVYMRTELKKIQLYGGTLLYPIYTAFPSESASESATEVVFGSSILAVFNFEQGSTTRKITLPQENSWLNLNSFQTYEGGVEISVACGPNDGIPLFQKSGTIVPIQDPKTENTTDEIKNVPISLSIALKEGRALGYVFLESGLENDFKNEFHKIWVENNVISFEQEDILGQQPNSNETVIEQIILTFVDQPVNVSCAIMKDMKTVFPLYPLDYNDAKKQVLLYTTDPMNPSTSKQFKINEVAFIFYGASSENVVCDSSLFSYHMEEELISPFDHIFEARLTQVASKFLPSLPAKHLRVELLSDNSVHFTIANTRFHGKEVRETPTEIYDRNFTQVKSTNRTIQLLDIMKVTMEKDNFCINITNPPNHPNPDQVLFSTCESLQIQHKSLNVFNFEQRASQKFFGIGERKGQFFLEDKTTYILYNNDNNVLNSYPVNGQVYVHGRNSFFPIIYSTIKDSKNLTALIYYTGHGLEISYTNIPDNQGGHFTIASGQQEIDFVFIFNLDPISTTEAVHRHVNLGNLHETKSKDFVLPPPSWALGHHISLPESIPSNDLVKYLENIKTLTKFPMEGIQISQHDLERELSFELSKKIFTQEALDYIAKNNLSVVPIVNTGVKSNEFILDTFRIKTLDDKDYYGFNQFGQVIYIDYSHPDSKMYIKEQIKQFRRKVTSIGKVAINMQKNEITLGQCSVNGGCQIGLLDLPDESYLINKPGNNDMHYNTLPQVKRYIGLESQLHNLNGLMEQMAYADSGENFALLLSASVSMGSGKIGFVGKQFEYFEVNDDDIKLANYQLQSMSLMGMPLLSVKYRSKIQSNVLTALQSVMLGVYETSISVQDYYGIVTRYASEEDLQNLRTLLKIKYLMMAYSRTQLMKQINFGTPFIRPQFFEFNGVDPDALSHQYMYGPSIISTTSAAYSSMTFPPSYWCTIAGGLFSTQPVCFNSYNPPAAIDMHVAMFIRENTITPLYWFNQSDNSTFQGSADLLQTPLALHIFNQMDGELGPWKSSGELLIDGGVGGSNNRDYCYIRMEMLNETLTVQDKSQQYGGNGKCQGMQGYEMRYIVFYNYKSQSPTQNSGFNAAKINNQIDMVLLEVDPLKQIGIFKVKDGNKVNIYDIKNIVFSEEPAPVATNI